MKVYFRPEINSAYGLGHLNRCLLLARQIVKTGNVPVFLLAENNDNSHIMLSEYSINYVTLPECQSLGEEVKSYPEDCTAIIVDLFHVGQLDNQNAICEYLRKLEENKITCVFIDALFEEAFRNDNAPEIPIVVQPYCGAEEDNPPKARHWIKGHTYMTMPEEYQSLEPKIIKKTAENLLITFGGSDPQSITAQVMEVFCDTDNGMNIRVIAGPFFSEDLVSRINKIQENSSSSFTVLGSQTSMIEHYRWADIALGSSGLSRYEFAAMGLPSIFTAIYKEHIKSCKIFASLSAALYLGLYSDLTEDDWHSSLDQLKGDYTKRLEMSQTGQKIIDGKGTERLINKILGLLING